MRALAKQAPRYGATELIDVDEPSVSDSEVMVEVSHAGLCGSDAGIFKFKDSYDFMTFPRVLGHEYSGTVVEVGAAVSSFAPGDRVVERPIRNCGECYQCKSGQENVCRNYRITGVHHDGAYAPLISVPSVALHRLPDDVSLRDAAITEPTSVAARAVTRNSRVSAGDTVLVEGPGPIGLLTAQIARAQGGTVVVSGVESDEAYRFPLAEDLGFETANVQSDSPERVRDAHTDDVGFDVVFDTTGHPSGLPTAAELVRKGGQVVVVGLPDRVDIDVTPLVRAELDVQCSYASRWDDFDTALRVLRSGVVDTESFIDDRFSLLEAVDGFEAFLDGETCKPVFDVSEVR